ncbi:GNAT family N-acetyltransferase [Lactiplantibacillus dongliensis]|uniref:GNAT family N-acetyltransferase n=1 Tax=Lactiplantibacillus dongliensis TaxID=2559919 RepID=A0ABW1R1E6_9LACO|nr:GNAT family N-acetyltransferase [Lactiplantibacillus dongliensis]
MIKQVSAAAVPRDLLLLADPDWQQVQTYLPTATIYGAVISGQVVGIGVLSKTKPGTNEVMNLAVTPSYQHQGIAKALLTQLITSCQQDQTVHNLEVGTGNSSIRQLQLYQRAGFEITAVWVNWFVDNYPEPIYEAGIQCKSMLRLRLAVDK